MRDFLVALATLSVFSFGCTSLPPGGIRRQALFRSERTFRPRVSPDGTKIAYIQTDIYGRYRFFVQPADGTGPAKEIELPIWRLRRGIGRYFWSGDSGHILYFNDTSGDENSHLYSLDLASEKVSDLAPLKSAKVRHFYDSIEVPDRLVVAVNARDNSTFDLYGIDLKTGIGRLETKNPGGAVDWLFDSKLRLVGYLTGFKSGNGGQLNVKEPGTAKWVHWAKQDPKIHFYNCHHASAHGDRIWCNGWSDANTLRLYEVTLATGEYKVVASDPQYDIDYPVLSPDHERVEGVRIEKERPEWMATSGTNGHLATLQKALGPYFHLESRDQKGLYWIVRPISDVTPGDYYLYDVRNAKVSLFSKANPALEAEHFQKTEPTLFQAKDGTELHGYLTLPSTGTAPYPMVVYVHGGPAERDTWDFDTEIQWLASRGYAVLQVNYRGSWGYGRKFQKAAQGEIGRKTVEDVIDATEWTKGKKIADPRRICIMGMGFGGFQVLSALASHPETYACGIAISGVSDLVAYLRDLPPYWSELHSIYGRLYGDPDKNDEILRARSPITQADRIRAPLFLIHGQNDPRSRVSQSERMYQELKLLGKPVEFRTMPETGHTYPWNLRYRIEEFLAQNIHGTYEGPSGIELRQDDSD